MKQLIKRLITHTLKIIISAWIFISKQKIRIIIWRVNRIGHLAFNTELYLRNRKALEQSGDWEYHDLIFIEPGLRSNEFLISLFKRYFKVIDLKNSFFHKLLHQVLVLTPSEYQANMPMNSNEYEATSNLPRILHFSKQDEARASKSLARLKIKDKQKIVCVNSRNSTYLNHYFPSRDWSYHDARNCRIENYEAAMLWLIKEGFWVIRMGSHDQFENLSSEIRQNEQYIDADEYQLDDFEQIYLAANTLFFLGCSAGIFCVPSIFERPIAGANFSHFELPSQRKGDIYLPKIFRNKKTKELLHFKKAFYLGLGKTTYNPAESGYEILENTPDEILELTKEMYYSIVQPDNFGHEKSTRFKLWCEIFPENHEASKLAHYNIGISQHFFEKYKHLII